MRIISKKTFKDFYEQKEYADSKTSLEAWHKEAINSNWQNPNDIKAQYKSASVVGNNRIVFNIHGNTYRLIVKINYYAQVVYIRFIGTHKQYDTIDAKEI